MSNVVTNADGGTTTTYDDGSTTTIHADGTVTSTDATDTGSATKTGGISGALGRVLDGTFTAADLLTLGITAATAASLFTGDGDRTSTSTVTYPDWYNAGSKSALAQADKFAALGPGSVAPLSANETAASGIARNFAGLWVPTLLKSNDTLDSSQQYFDKAGALAESVPGYLARAGEQVDAAMPYFEQADTMADTVGGYLDRSGALADEAAGGIPSIDLSAYMNPYLDNVLTPIARRNELAKAAALNDINARAGMRGAFGGSRNDLLTNLASESADRNMNEAEANIRSGAFTTGLTAAQADLSRKLAASGQFGTLGTVAGNTANIYSGIGGKVADTADRFSNMGVVATKAADTGTTIGRGLVDTAGGFRSNVGAFGTSTDADISRLASTGAVKRSIEQAALNAPLTAIGGYANALRGTPNSTTTNVVPGASGLAQATGALTALLGANKAGWI